MKKKKKNTVVRIFFSNASIQFVDQDRTYLKTIFGLLRQLLAIILVRRMAEYTYAAVLPPGEGPQQGVLNVVLQGAV